MKQESKAVGLALAEDQNELETVKRFVIEQAPENMEGDLGKFLQQRIEQRIADADDRALAALAGLRVEAVYWPYVAEIVGEAAGVLPDEIEPGIKRLRFADFAAADDAEAAMLEVDLALSSDADIAQEIRGCVDEALDTLEAYLDGADAAMSISDALERALVVIRELERRDVEAFNAGLDDES